MRDGVVQFTRQQRAFFAHCGLALQRRRPQTLQRAGQVAAQGVQQFGFVGRQLDVFTEKQVQLAQQALLEPNGHTHHRAVAQTGARAARGLGHALNGDDADARLALRLRHATGAGTGHQAALGFGQVIWEAVRSQHQEALVGFV